jgi:hypothetical protein
MENIAPIRAQIASIIISFGFLLYIARLIVKEKLRAEYSIVWILSTLILLLFSFWRSGLELLAGWLGVYSGLNLAFAGAILAVLIYLLHLSIVASALHDENKTLAQQIALIKEKLKDRGH